MLAGCPVLCSVRAACASAPLVHSSPPALFPALGRQNSDCVLLLSLPAGDIGNALPVGSGTGGKRGRAASPLRLPVCRLGWLMTTVRCELRRHPTPSLSPSTCRFLCVYLATLVVSLAEPRGGSGLAGVSQVKKPSRKKPIKGDFDTACGVRDHDMSLLFSQPQTNAPLPPLRILRDLLSPDCAEVSRQTVVRGAGDLRTVWWAARGRRCPCRVA